MGEKPVKFNSAEESFDEFKKRLAIVSIVDTYKEQLEDLFLIRNPKYKFNKNYQADFENFLAEHLAGESMDEKGDWFYFPWNKTLVHYLEDGWHQEVRTARNKNLITAEEQEKFYDFKVGVAGLSVGSHGAVTTALMGGCKLMKLADPDVISPSNLNRMRFDFSQVGVNKADLIARYIYQLNPYAEIFIYKEGINKKNLEGFLDGLDILVEELDDVEIKIKIREEARKRRIPVIMATDNGDNVIVDIERFDLHPDTPVFHGNLEGFDLAEIKKSPQGMYEAMARIIDISLVPPRVLRSVLEVGKTLYSWPQLASAATLSGAVIAYVVKRIALNESIAEGKLEVNLDYVFDPNYKKNEGLRRDESEKFLESIMDQNSNHG